jgi:hypothetical protein
MAKMLSKAIEDSVIYDILWNDSGSEGNISDNFDNEEVMEVI